MLIQEKREFTTSQTEKGVEMETLPRSWTIVNTGTIHLNIIVS